MDIKCKNTQKQIRQQKLWMKMEQLVYFETGINIRVRYFGTTHPEDNKNKGV
jgi:hypothetical protein